MDVRFVRLSPEDAERILSGNTTGYTVIDLDQREREMDSFQGLQDRYVEGRQNGVYNHVYEAERDMHHRFGIDFERTPKFEYGELRPLYEPERQTPAPVLNPVQIGKLETVKKGAKVDPEVALIQMVEDNLRNLTTKEERDFLQKRINSYKKEIEDLVPETNSTRLVRDRKMLGLMLNRIALNTKSDVLPKGKARKNVIMEDLPGSFFVESNEEEFGNKPIHEFSVIGNQALTKHGESVEKYSKKHGVDPLLVATIMYMEESRGYYDKPLSLVDKNKSILPMNINTEYWGTKFGSRKDLKDPSKNIEAGVMMIREIYDHLPEGNNSVAVVATLYNSINKTKVSEYGVRATRVYSEFKKQNP
ncbi:MAG: hypothetical protein CMO55_01460 [Verrucomicrobiales bacterium]|nr:hypothetical protein [Verrucomicrobiales bacterium]